MGKQERGSILIIVLWSLFFLSMLAVAVASYVGSRADLAGRLLRRAKMHYLAKAGIKKAMLELEKDRTEEYDSLKDAWAGDIEGGLADGTFAISVTDEERRININKASYDVLKNFLEIAGDATSQDAEDIADSIIDWRDEDDDTRKNGAEDGYYSILHPGYPCKNSDFESVEELLLVKGMTEEIFEKMRDMATVYGEGAVNINTADGLILQSLGMTEELAGKIISFRDDNVFEDVKTITSVLSEIEDLSGGEITRLNRIFAAGQFCVRSDNFKGESSGSIKKSSEAIRITFIFDRNERRIRYWRET